MKNCLSKIYESLCKYIHKYKIAPTIRDLINPRVISILFYLIRLSSIVGSFFFFLLPDSSSLYERSSYNIEGTFFSATTERASNWKTH